MLLNVIPENVNTIAEMTKLSIGDLMNLTLEDKVFIHADDRWTFVDGYLMEKHIANLIDLLE